jgi:hypothetical protein
VATKANRNYVRGLIEGLETRVHNGPPIGHAEILSAREYLRCNEFSPASDYHNRLAQIQHRVSARSNDLPQQRGKRNYGGEAAGYWMQVQSAYDHVILSTCYDGEFNLKRGRIKLSHRFNQEGRIDFVELKFLQSLHSCLNGEIRKLLMIAGYQSLRKDWRVAEAYVLEVLPRELVFLFSDIFRCPKTEVFAWLVNIGHGLLGDLLRELRTRAANGSLPVPLRNPEQMCLPALLADEVALPILEKAAALESTVEIKDSKSVEVRYVGRET